MVCFLRSIISIVKWAPLRRSITDHDRANRRSSSHVTRSGDWHLCDVLYAGLCDGILRNFFTAETSFWRSTRTAWSQLFYQRYTNKIRNCRLYEVNDGRLLANRLYDKSGLQVLPDFFSQLLKSITAVWYSLKFRQGDKFTHDNGLGIAFISSFQILS